jgi:hypothetical protein
LLRGDIDAEPTGTAPTTGGWAAQKSRIELLTKTACLFIFSMFIGKLNASV